MKTTEPPVIVEEIFNNTLENVWNAITVKEKMVQWFFDNIPDFKAEIAFKTKFNVKAPSRDFMHLWEVTEVLSLKKLVVNWKYEDCAGNSFVIWELENLGAQTKVKLTTKVTEDFSDDYPEFRRESCVSGWNYFIKENLKSYLEK